MAAISESMSPPLGSEPACDDVFGFSIDYDEQPSPAAGSLPDEPRYFDEHDDDDCGGGGIDLPFWVQQAAFSPPSLDRAGFFLPSPAKPLQSPRPHAVLSVSPPTCKLTSPAKPIGRDLLRASADQVHADDGQYSSSAPHKSYVLVELGDASVQQELREEQEALRRMQQQRRMQQRVLSAEQSTAADFATS